MNTAQWFSSDLRFHKLYPDPLPAQASMHWTPLYIVRKAAAFLSAEKNKKILDIGSGAGKFCLAAAWYQPACFFYGVEQRENLVNAAHAAQQQVGLANVSFIHSNIKDIGMDEYDHFYFFNSFYENLNDEYKIDAEIIYSKELYDSYNRYLYKQLDKKPPGTRLATFHSTQDEIPSSYHEVGGEGEVLKFWMKA